MGGWRGHSLTGAEAGAGAGSLSPAAAGALRRRMLEMPHCGTA